jgi:hypothetical protein
VTNKFIDPPAIKLSVKVYQVLLVAYPIKFQQEYGPHMSQVFRDCCLRVFEQERAIGLLKLWAITLLDFVQSVISEHAQKEILMRKEDREEITHLGGWALMLGGITFFLFFLGIYLENNVDDPLGWLSSFIEASLMIFFVITPILLMVGILGLRIRYGEEVGSFGKTILLLGAIAGPAMDILGYIIAAYELVDWGVFLFISASTVPLVCIALFGVAALRSKPLPRWNILPLLTGLWYPVSFFAFFYIQATTEEWPVLFSSILDQVLILIQSVPLFLLGYVLQGDVPEETPSIA